MEDNDSPFWKSHDYVYETQENELHCKYDNHATEYGNISRYDNSL